MTRKPDAPVARHRVKHTYATTVPPIVERRLTTGFLYWIFIRIQKVLPWTYFTCAINSLAIIPLMPAASSKYRTSAFSAGSAHTADGIFWPDPLIQLNPSFQSGGTVSELVQQGMLHPECERVFSRGKDRQQDFSFGSTNINMMRF